MLASLRYLPLLLAVTLTADPLSEPKSELLRLKRAQATEQMETDRTSWISPLTLSLGYTRSKAVQGGESTSRDAGVSWNQDLFRSGGIFYTIEQAEASGKVNLIAVDLEEAGYLKQAYTLKAQTLRDTLKLRQSELTLANRDIDLQIIQAKYKIGTADISSLNRAAIDRDSAQTDLITVRNTLRNETFELQKVLGGQSVAMLPTFPLVSEETYLAGHLELLQYAAQQDADIAGWKVTRASYLPTLSFTASYGYSDYSGSAQEVDGDRYSYGATLSMPLDLNSRGTIEVSRLQSLQSAAALTDRRQELHQEYTMRRRTIEDYEEKIRVARKMIAMYDDLQQITQNRVGAGYDTSYDLESLENSVAIQKLETQIQDYNIQIERITLYFDTRTYKER